MIHRLLTALYRFEDSPAGMCLGVATVFALPLILLALNEGGMR